jgi:hypothetical protein
VNPCCSVSSWFPLKIEPVEKRENSVNICSCILVKLMGSICNLLVCFVNKKIIK